jgi:hypothetical protein
MTRRPLNPYALPLLLVAVVSVAFWAGVIAALVRAL